MHIRRVTFRLYPNKKQEQLPVSPEVAQRLVQRRCFFNRFVLHQSLVNLLITLNSKTLLPAFKEVWTEYKDAIA